MTERAEIRDEGVAVAPWLVYLRLPTGKVVGTGIRFGQRENAAKVARAINRALENESR